MQGPRPPSRHDIRRMTLASCERAGIEGVRNAILRNAYPYEQKVIAQQWLTDAERRRDELDGANQREIDRSIARDSSRAAFRLGVSGNVIALGALAVSVYALLR